MLILLLILSGCDGESSAMERAMSVRSRLLESGCEFSAVITADYQDSIYEFHVMCSSEANGDLLFEVTSPESISGITGTVSDSGGKLTFDDKALMFPILSEGLPSPVSAPWMFLKALKSGYISGAGRTDTGICIDLDDTYEDNAVKLSVQMNSDNVPVFAELFWQGRRMITMQVENFRYL